MCCASSRPKSVANSGSPLTVARPCRIYTGFLSRTSWGFGRGAGEPFSAHRRRLPTDAVQRGFDSKETKGAVVGGTFASRLPFLFAESEVRVLTGQQQKTAFRLESAIRTISNVQARNQAFTIGAPSDSFSVS